MNESIRVRFMKNGSQRPVTKLDLDTGIIFAGETSAKPLGIGFGFRGDNPISREAMKTVRQIEDWPGETFKLSKPVLDNGDLVFRGGGTRKPETSLPPGRYSFSFEVSETPLRDWAPVADVPKNGEAQVQLEEKPYNRQFELADLALWDAEVKALCSAGGSKIDGQAALDWLQSPSPRIRRKACLLNLMAKARALPSTRPGQSLCPKFDSILWADTDRIICAVKGEHDLRTLITWKKDGIVHPVHAENFAMVNGGKPDDYEVTSFREPVGTTSMQIVVGVHKTTGRQLADLDIDLGNPGVDAVGLFVHIGELIDSGRTNHLDLRRDLTSGGTGDFLYYNLV